MTGWRGTLLLLVLAAGLALALRWTGGDDTGDGDLTEPALDGRHLLDAQRIAVRPQPDAQLIELRRGAGYAFEMVEPLRDVASRAVLLSLGSAFDTARLIETYAPEDLTDDLLDQLGLRPPRAEINADFGEHTVRLEIGEEGPLGEDVYVRKNGKVYRGGKALYTVLQGTPDDYREHVLFRNDASTWRKLAIETPHQRLAVERGGGAEYRITEPISARAQPAECEALATAILGLTVGRFVGGNMTPPGRADCTIEVDGGAGQESLQLWFQPDGSPLALLRPRELVFALPRADYSTLLLASADGLRSRLLIPAPPDDLAELQIDPGAGRGKALVLRRAANQLLEVAEPVRAPAHAPAVTRVLEALAVLTAQSFVDAGPEDYAALGLEAGPLSITAKGRIDTRAVTVLLGRIEGDVCYARRADEPWVVTVPKRCAEAFAAPWTEFVGRIVYQAPAIDNIWRLQYRRGDRTWTYAKGEDGAWHREGEAEVSETARAAVIALCDLRAVAVREPEAEEPADEVHVELQLENGMLVQRLGVRPVGTRALVRTPKLAVTYEVDEPTAAKILAPAQ